MTTKQCIDCKEEKDISLFGHTGKRNAYVNNRCRICMKTWNALPKSERDRLTTLRREEYRTRIEKTCPTCKETKPRDGFYNKAGAADGMSAECRSCDDRRGKARRKSLKTEEKKLLTHQVCRMCNTDKPIDQFGHNSGIKSGYNTHCKPCEKIKWDRYVSSNDNRILILLQRIRTKCNKENIEFDLVVDDIVIPAVCPVLGIPLRFGGTRGYYSNATEGSPSVDRIDPNGGYVKDNIVIVSWRANRLKGNAMIEELRKIADFYEAHNCRKAAGMVAK